MPELRTEHIDALNDLRLDPLNPRLRKHEEGESQDALIGIMVSRFKVEEVAESIVSAGWLDQDPLIAILEEGEYIVVEGNRRLTAVKLLLDPSLAPTSKQARWEAISSDLKPETRTQIANLKVRVYESRDDPEVSSYIGFRHVTGVLPWPALEKASYIARLAARGMSYKELAERLGSYPSHMRRHHVAFQLVEQAETWEIPGAEEMGRSFGVLLRALQTEGASTFLHLSQSDEPDANTHPVAEENREDFARFVKWTFGTSESTRVLPESRELTKWSRILLSEPAVRYLTLTPEPRFERAWGLSGGEKDSLADALWKASYLLADSVPRVDAHKDDQAIREAVIECNRYMLQIVGILEPLDG